MLRGWSRDFRQVLAAFAVSSLGSKIAREAVPLTAVDMPGRMMGQEAIRLLMDEVASGKQHRHATVVLEPELIVRSSAPN